jgi:tRNA(Ile)-lysidine synthase
VALSGGADSTALLLLAHQQWPGQVRAAHVHHGLQAAADDFAAHCAQLCARLGVPLDVLRVQARHAPGDSPEAAARHARYTALAAWAQSPQSPQSPQSQQPQQSPQSPARQARHRQSAATPDVAPPLACVLLGQHADDQLETVLLALSRGAGVAGLAGMAARFERGGAHFARPLLAIAAGDIRDWLRVQGLGWIEDPSNADPRYTRNRIRQLLPTLLAAFPALRGTAARSASLCAQASTLLDERADDDLQQLCARPGNGPSIAGLQSLSPERQANAIRRWLALAHGTTPSQAQMSALLPQLAACRTRGHRIALKMGRGTLMRLGDVLVWTQ